MRKFTSLALAAALALPTTGCLFAHTRSPLDTDLNVTKLGPKRGDASAHSILWLVAWGDASSAAAAKSADIKILNHMDSEQLLILFGLYTRLTTIVYGD